MLGEDLLDLVVALAAGEVDGEDDGVVLRRKEDDHTQSNGSMLEPYRIEEKATYVPTVGFAFN